MAKHKEYGVAWNCYYLLLSLFFLFVLGMLILYLPNIREFDYIILDAIRKPLLKYSGTLPIFISTFGIANLWLWPRISLCAVLISHGHYLKTCLFFGLSQLMFWLSSDYIKHWICRERPCGTASAGFGFPSVHAAFALLFFGAIFYLAKRYVKNDGWKIFLMVISVLWIILMGISVIWLNQNFLTDVIGGYLLGLAFLNLFILGAKFFED